MRWRKMRIPIREQIGLLVLFSALVGVMVVSVATWMTNRSFVINVRSSRLSLTASLKAAQLSSDLTLMQNSVTSTTTRLLIQSALQRYNVNNNNTYQNWVRSTTDLQSALSPNSAGLGFQAAVLPKNSTGSNGGGFLMNATDSSILGTVRLPYNYPDGSPVYLGDNNTYGYPRSLYPNLTYFEVPINSTYNMSMASYEGQVINQTNGLLLGPWFVNSSFSLVSLTYPVVNNSSPLDLLGWLTMIMNASPIRGVAASPEGLDKTGVTLIVGADNETNHFPNGVTWETNRGNPPDNQQIRFILPANNTNGRHPDKAYQMNNNSFDYSQYPAAKKAITVDEHSINNAGSDITTKNEQGYSVSVGFATVPNKLVDWFVIIEQAHSETWEPIAHLRNLLLACAFGTAGGALILAFPVAHYSSRPIRRLRDATSKAVAPPGYEDELHSDSSRDDPNGHDTALARKEGFFGALTKWRPQRKNPPILSDDAARRRAFKIPVKVKERKHIIRDELTELTTTFNEMTDELIMQYERLEERVRQRTAELEQSKRAAEAANESKTLFVANLSHELKTPLNGILGMCAVSMDEPDPAKVQKSLAIIYKSGDLLLNLLTDLLTFSKNQVQQLTLEEKEFRLRDQAQQLLAIFDQQAKEKHIDLAIRYEGQIEHNMTEIGMPADRRDMGPPGTGRIKDMILFGDQNRLLQVLINLVSNSLKFTPKDGSVSIAIRCLGDWRSDKTSSRRASLKGSLHSRGSRNFSGRNSRTRGHGSDASFISSNKNINTALEINAFEKTPSHISAQERTSSPPIGRDLLFEFEVQDTGPGIPENQQQKIFEPFVQGDLGLSKKYGGTGLGLSICSQIASLMKGNIAVASEVGHGSTFTMQIPLRHVGSRADSQASSTADPNSRRESISLDGSADRKLSQATSVTMVPSSSSTNHAPPLGAESQPMLIGLSKPFFSQPSPEIPESKMATVERMAAEASQSGNKVRVLVAEDNKTNQEVVLRMLKLEKIFDVTVAQDGQEAFDLVKDSMASCKPYNLIFMDVQMPNLNGLESTRLIRETGYSAPIVALSAYSEDTNVKDCLESGMNDFISKPIRRPRLKQVLKTFCNPIPEEKDEDKLDRARSASAAEGKVKAMNLDDKANGQPREDVVAKPTLNGEGEKSVAPAAAAGVPESIPEATTRSHPTTRDHDPGGSKNIDGRVSPMSKG